MIWDAKYETGIIEIDKQHKKWVKLTKTLLDALLTDTVISHIKSIFHDAFEYTNTHFVYEEKLMVECNYSDIEMHTKQHKKMIEMLNEFKNRIEAAPSDTSATSEMVQMAKVFHDWLFKHIENEDRKYVPCIKKLINKG
jgi:hemerythrin